MRNVPVRAADTLIKEALAKTTATATATGTPQNNRLNEQKQWSCTCLLRFGTFLCHHQQKQQQQQQQQQQQREMSKFKVFRIR